MSWDQTWEKVFQAEEWGKYPSESLIRFVARNYYKGNRGQTKILEIGCGPGANIWYMAREGFDVYGIDGSETAIEKAKTRIKKNDLRANLEVGDIMNLPYEDNFFDAIVDNECLYCNSWTDTEMILAEIKRVLKQDGLFFSRTFSDHMYIGNNYEKVDEMEYRNISDGPFAGKGFVRLTSRREINELYGIMGSIISIDEHRYTLNNAAVEVSEWVIICRKGE